MKKIISLITALVLITVVVPTFSAFGSDFGDEIAQPEPVASMPQEDAVIEEAQPFASSTRVEYSDSNIIGGSIYYNPETG